MLQDTHTTRNGDRGKQAALCHGSSNHPNKRARNQFYRPPTRTKRSKRKCRDLTVGVRQLSRTLPSLIQLSHLFHSIGCQSEAVVLSNLHFTITSSLLELKKKRPIGITGCVAAKSAKQSLLPSIIEAARGGQEVAAGAVSKRPKMRSVSRRRQSINLQALDLLRCQHGSVVIGVSFLQSN